MPRPPKHPWSKLQSRLYLLIDPHLRFQIHCSLVRMDSSRGSTDLPRYWITLNGETIWDYPGQFLLPGGATRRTDSASVAWYPYNTDVPLISDLIREYIDTPAEELMSRRFDGDHWGLANILRAADRRIGRRQWPALRRKTHNQAARLVLAARAAERPAGSRRSAGGTAVYEE